MPEINHNGGGWDMRTEGVERSVSQLDSSLADFESAWQRQAMPLTLKIALGILGFQVLINGAFGAFMVYESIGDAEHGREVPFVQHLLGYGSVVVAAVLLACGLLLIRRVRAARPVVACIEVLAAFSGIAAIVQGAPQGTVGMVLALLALMHLYRADATDWLDGLSPNVHATPQFR